MGRVWEAQVWVRHGISNYLSWIQIINMPLLIILEITRNILHIYLHFLLGFHLTL